MTRRNRFIAALLACLLAGCFAQVGIAWLLAHRPGFVLIYSTECCGVVPSDWPIPTPPGTPVPLQHSRYVRWWFTNEEYSSRKPPILTELDRAIAQLNFVDISLHATTMSESSYGFPFRSMRSVWAYYGLHRHRTHYALDIPTPWGSTITVPGMPVWPGFALNTIIYGAACYTLWHVLITLRRRRRALHNVCPTCSYPRTGLPANAPCPECGTGSPTS